MKCFSNGIDIICILLKYSSLAAM